MTASASRARAARHEPIAEGKPLPGGLRESGVGRRILAMSAESVNGCPSQTVYNSAVPKHRIAPQRPVHKHRMPQTRTVQGDRLDRLLCNSAHVLPTG